MRYPVIVADIRRPLRSAALVAGLASAALGLWADTSHASTSLKACRPGKLCQNFRVQVSFKQHRTWTHHTSATNSECSRFGSGNGSDDAELALLQAGGRGHTSDATAALLDAVAAA